LALVASLAHSVFYVSAVGLVLWPYSGLRLHKVNIMGKANVYTVNQGSGPTYFEVQKFDEDLNLEGTHHVSEIGMGLYICSCPAGGRTSCRHRDMVRLFCQQQLVGKRWTYHFDKQKWSPPPFQDEGELA